MAIKINVPTSIALKPIITVFGVGGAGGNAINNMIVSKLGGVNFVAANTDAQALEQSLADSKIQLGGKLTQGLGAGANPKVGSAAAEETIDEIMSYIGDSNMVFITAGMGGGTGTGAAPVIARTAKQNDILTIGVVTKPFNFEGVQRMKLAMQGIEELEKYVDTLIVIPNQNLFKIASPNTTFAEAFKLADKVLYSGVRGVTDLIMMPGIVNLDFADIRTVMNEMGKAMMGSGEADGENRAIKAAEAAIANPLLENSSMKGAKGVLINITGGEDMTLFEVDEAANRIRAEVDNEDANIIFGSAFDDSCAGKIRVSVVATGINSGLTPGQLNKKHHLRQLTLHSHQIETKGMLHTQTELELSNQGKEESDLIENIKTEQPIKKQKTSFWSKILGKEEENDIQINLDTAEEDENSLDLHKKYQTPALLRKKERISE